MMQLSAHFSLAELTKSQVALRRGLDNTPGEREIANLRRLTNGVLEPVRARFSVPFSPSSGYRSPALNRLVGSHDGSQHLTGEAADFELPGVSNTEVARWIAAALEYDQLILEFYEPDDPSSGWVHCSLKAVHNRRQTLTIGRAGVRVGLI